MSESPGQNELRWKLGVELELMAPPGSSRRHLAETLAERAGGSVRAFFHPQSEPSKVPGKPIFHNLTLGFEVIDAEGEPVARCVDDLTLQFDFNRTASPVEGWYRIVGDDERILRLIARFADASRPIPEALEEARALWDTELLDAPGGMYRLVDEIGAPICIAAPLPGERERPCELVTPPLERDHRAALEHLCGVAHELDFGIPRESATHIHFDAEPLCSPKAIASLVNLLSAYAEPLRKLVSTNPSCRRLGAWPPALFKLVRSPAFQASPDWEQAREQLAALKLSKYCDFNLKNIAHGFEHRHTFEVRILPGTLDPDEVIAYAALFEAILRHVSEGPPFPPRPPRSMRALTRLLKQLPMSDASRGLWLKRARA